MSNIQKNIEKKLKKMVEKIKLKKLSEKNKEPKDCLMIFFPIS